ncbi:10105_t:CDS:10 [Entrophospora sp. SA101]|nr:10105_t:CDS:10 [Entrophospora sp. SA101]
MSNNNSLPCIQKLNQLNESAWLAMGAAAELLQEYDRAMSAYESALRHNAYSITALQGIASLCRGREQFPRAIEYFQRILNIDARNGDIWGSLALYHLPNPKEPKLWYGIGILYDRYGSLDHAEEAFSQVIRMDSKFEKANEIYFRLGIIYKQQLKYEQSLECFKYILNNPPRPLTEVDIWFQIGHVYEQQKNFTTAKEAYERVLIDNPTHAKVLQQLGWLYHQQSPFRNQDVAISYLTRSLESDGNDAQAWYFLGRCYMAQQKYGRAYEAYQQAVFRDGRNPTFWCSIGVLYYQINQYRDALDAYSRAIRLNPYISEVWYDLGTLYESCNNQVNDALDAYQRAAELDPANPHIKQRLQMLRNQQTQGGQTTAPIPQDINPQAFQQQTNPNSMFGNNPGPLLGSSSSSSTLIEVWYDLGTLYESCNNQVNDALDAYQRAAELDPANPHIKQRLQMLRNQQTQGGQTTAPIPQDINPQAFQQQTNPNSMFGNNPGPLLGSSSSSSTLIQRDMSRKLPPMNATLSPTPTQPTPLIPPISTHIRDSTRSNSPPPTQLPPPIQRPSSPSLVGDLRVSSSPPPPSSLSQLPPPPTQRSSPPPLVSPSSQQHHHHVNESNRANSPPPPPSNTSTNSNQHSLNSIMSPHD